MLMIRQKEKGPDVSSSMDKDDLKRLIQGSIEIFRARGGEKNHLNKKKNYSFCFSICSFFKKN